MTDTFTTNDPQGKGGAGMSDFFSERRIKATRKEHHCASCCKKIAVNQHAFYAASNRDGDFFTWHSHIECRAAEIAWNNEAGRYGDDSCWLWEALKYDDDKDASLEWLQEHHPIAASRLTGAPVTQRNTNATRDQAARGQG